MTSGYAYGDIVNHLFGPAAGQPVLYAVVAMGAVFTSAARAPQALPPRSRHPPADAGPAGTAVSMAFPGPGS